MALDQGARIAGVALPMQHARGPRVGFAIVLDLIEARQADDGVLAAEPGAFVGTVEIGCVGFAPAVRHGRLEEGNAADVVEACDDVACRPLSSLGKPVGDLDDGALGIAVEQDVGFGVGEDRAAHLVGPVVVMGDPAQRALDAAEHDRHVAKRFAAALGIDDHRAVGPPAAFAARRIAVVVAQPPVGGVAVDHGVHVAAGDAEEEGRPAERRKRFGALPVRLGDDPDPEALRLQQAADDRHAEARMVDIGIAGHQDDVALIPAEHVHLGARHRQERRGAEPMRPMAAVGKQRFGGVGLHAGHLRCPRSQSMAIARQSVNTVPRQ